MICTEKLTEKMKSTNNSTTLKQSLLIYWHMLVYLNIFEIIHTYLIFLR